MSFSNNSKIWFTNCKLVCHKKNALFKTVSVFLSLKPLVFCRNLVLRKCTFLCPFFGGNHELGKSGAHCFLHNSNRTKNTKRKSETTLFCSNLSFVKQQKPDLMQQRKAKTLIAHIGVFCVKQRLCLKN